MSTAQPAPINALTLTAEELRHLQDEVAESGRPVSLAADGLPQGFDPWWNGFDHPLHWTVDQHEAEEFTSRALTLLRRALRRSNWQTTSPHRLVLAVAVEEALETRLLTQLPRLVPMARGRQWRPAAIRGDWMRPEAVSYLGWIMDGQRWNGWVIPRFPAAEVRRMIEENRRLERRQAPEADELRISRDEPGLPLIVEMHRPVYAADLGYQPEQYIEDADGTLSIGAMNWTWQEDIESAAAARLRLRDTKPLTRRSEAAEFFRACARVLGEVFDLDTPGDGYAESSGAPIFGPYDAELYDARVTEARARFERDGENPAHYCRTLMPPRPAPDDSVYRLPANEVRRVLASVIREVNMIARGLQRRPGLDPWRASGSEASAVRVWLPEGHMAFFELGERGERLACLRSPIDEPIETPAVADILDAYRPAHYDQAHEREYIAAMGSRIARDLRDLRDLLT